MEKRRYKIHGAGGNSNWKTGSTLAMLESMPSMHWYLKFFRVVPPLHIINELLASGIDETGMSGGCEWKPFILLDDEYEEIVEGLITSPDFQCEIDSELNEIKTSAKWRTAVYKKYGEIARNRTTG